MKPFGHKVSLTNSIGTTSLLAACLEDCDMKRAAEADVTVTVAEIARCMINMVEVCGCGCGCLVSGMGRF